MELGDYIEEALTKIGITDSRVSRWLGKPCNCQERREKLNQLSVWAKRVCKGKVKRAEEYLTKMING